MLKYLVIIVLITISLVGCREDLFYTQSFDIENYTWDAKDVKELEAIIQAAGHKAKVMSKIEKPAAIVAAV